MEKNEAINQINEIHKILTASNRIIFSGKTLFCIGIMVILIPLIEWATKSFTFGFNYGEYSTIIITFFHVAFYWGLSEVISRFAQSKEAEKSRTNHPLTSKAFSISRPIVIAIVGSVVMFILRGHGEFAFPVTYLFLGVLFNLYGRFTNKYVVNISWSYIVLGLIYIYITQYNIPYLAWYFTTYLGVSYIAMSKLLNRTGE